MPKFDLTVMKFDLAVMKLDFVVRKFDLVVVKFDLGVMEFDLAVAPKDEGQVQNCVCFLWGVIFTHCVARVPPVR